MSPSPMVDRISQARPDVPDMYSRDETQLRLSLDKLAQLDNEGIRVNAQGRITDWADRPGCEGSPAVPQDSQEHRRKRREFLPSEEQLLLVWCGAAAEQKLLPGTSVFEQLECLRPNRSWQAYESKWRQGDLSTRPRPAIQSHAPFPSLRCDRATADGHGSIPDLNPHTQNSIELSNPASPRAQPTQGDTVGPSVDIQHLTHLVSHNDARDLSYSDFRVDIHQNLLQNLGLPDDDSFLQLLLSPWFASIYNDFLPSLQEQRSRDQRAISSTGNLPRTMKGKAHHRVKIDRALAQSCRYTAESPNKKLWDDDDHDVRFVVRLMRAAQRQGNIIWDSSIDHTIEKFGEIAYWLMLWLRWVYKPTLGQSEESNRRCQRKEEWLAVLEGLQGRQHDRQVDRDSGRVTPDPKDNPEALNRSRGSVVGTEEASPDPIAGETVNVAMSVTRQFRNPDDNLRRPPPQYSVPLNNAKVQQKAIFWLTEDAFLAFKHQREQMLNSWGVTVRHSSTCVLVPSEWAHTPPLSLLDNVPWGSSVKKESHRLRINLGDTCVAWARAEAWFKPWPAKARRGVDLDQFLTGSDGAYVEMHGSHLCHHGHCILPEHIVYETRTLNSHRNFCLIGAQELRANGVEIPPRCRKHDPPCLLQSAALTTHEAALIQLSILRQVYGIPAPEEEPLAPADHPRWYTTFEFQLPTCLPLSSLVVDPAHLTVADEDPRPRYRRRFDPFSIRCRFCSGVQRVWQSIAAYWSHVKFQHEDVAERPKLAAITRSAEEYLSWIEARSANYARDNPSTWLKLQQATADDFDWETVLIWRLPQDRSNERLRDGDRAANEVEL